MNGWMANVWAVCAHATLLQIKVLYSFLYIVIYLFVHVNNLQSFKAQSPLQMELGSVSTKVFAPLIGQHILSIVFKLSISF